MDIFTLQQKKLNFVSFGNEKNGFVDLKDIETEQKN